jgi:hypothetical protein
MGRMCTVTSHVLCNKNIQCRYHERAKEHRNGMDTVNIGTVTVWAVPDTGIILICGYTVFGIGTVPYLQYARKPAG